MRHPDQRLVAFALDKVLLAPLDAARKTSGQNRSDYIREAVEEKLRVMGIALPDAISDAPDRAGKTYRPRVVTSYRAEQKSAPSSKSASAAKAAGERAAASERRPGPK